MKNAPKTDYIQAVKSKYGATVFIRFNREKSLYIVYYLSDARGSFQFRKAYKTLTGAEKYILRVIDMWKSDIAAKNILPRYIVPAC